MADQHSSPGPEQFLEDALMYKLQTLILKMSLN